MCKNNGIILIEVPYTVDMNDIENFIINECRNNGYTL